MDFNEIVAAFTGGLVTCIAGYVGQRITRWIDTNEEMSENIKALHQDVAAMQAKVQSTEAQLDILQDGVLALSRDRIVQSELHFLKLGEVPMQVKENLNQMADAYHRMGGNGVVSEIHERFMDLPTTL